MDNTQKIERIDNIIEQLKAKHGSECTDIQYRVWTESFDTPYHQSLDIPPQASLFKSQGRKCKSSNTIQHLILPVQLETHPMVQSWHHKRLQL